MQRLLGLEVTRTYVRAVLFDVSLRKTTVEALEEVSVEDAGGQKEALWAAVGDLKPDGASVALSGEKAFYRHVLQHAKQPCVAMLEHVKAALEAHADGEPFPNDISLVALARER